MTNNIQERIQEKLSCPFCGGDFFAFGDRFKCSKCKKVYLMNRSIPVLLSDMNDINHLEEEEKLFQKMKDKAAEKGVQLEMREWALSKKEFWNIVKKDLPKKGVDILNVGCGYDDAFVAIEKEGHTFVNMDIIDLSLKYLQDNFSASNCVVGDVNFPPFKTESFDIVTCIDVLHHEERHMRRVLRSIHKILKKKGVLYLQDVNAWGLFQFYKSVILPRFIHKFLREFYHRMKNSDHVPAEYEFPTSIFRVKKILKSIGYKEVVIHKNYAYPEVGKIKLSIYRRLMIFCRISKYHNYHYSISAKK